MGTVGAIIVGVHLAIPILGLILLGIRRERKRLEAERIRVARLLMCMTRSRRFRIG